MNYQAKEIAIQSLHKDGFRYTPIASTWYQITPLGRVSVAEADVPAAGGFTADDLPRLRLALSSVETHAASLPQK